jgi:hypothetical protein
MIDLPTALRNTLQQLQADPPRYKLFGVYWGSRHSTVRGTHGEHDQAAASSGAVDAWRNGLNPSVAGVPSASQR